MTHFIATIKYILPYMDGETKLNLRATSKPIEQEVVAHTSAPYKDIHTFNLAIAKIFYSKNYFKEAWHLYKQTINSESVKPALIYKLRDKPHFIHTVNFKNFLDGDEVMTTGRIYNPKKHCWDLNLIWVMAQVHKERNFEVFSSFNDVNIFRVDGFHYSTYMKEIACAVKVGYEIEINLSGKISLIAPEHQGINFSEQPTTSMTRPPKNFGIDDIDINENDIDYAITQIKRKLSENSPPQKKPMEHKKPNVAINTPMFQSSIFGIFSKIKNKITSYKVYRNDDDYSTQQSHSLN